MPGEQENLLRRVRERCREVADRASLVRVVPDRIDAYARAVVPESGPTDTGSDPGTGSPSGGNGDEARVALTIALDAVNFGSGYHPHVRKLPGRSGARTMAARLRAWADESGGVRAERLAELDRDHVHRIFDQPATPEMTELMGLFTVALNELGRFVTDEHGASFLALVASADQSANRLTTILATLATYADVSWYDGMDVPFLKRAQITAADLHRDFAGSGPGAFDDIDELTAFADNLVPHVLRIDGLLELDPALARSIDGGELLIHGSRAEVELRACGVHAVELIGRSARDRGVGVTSATLDEILWTRGAGPSYKAVPRPRSRTTAY